jgi:hypothetical protein
MGLPERDTSSKPEERSSPRMKPGSVVKAGLADEILPLEAIGLSLNGYIAGAAR